MCVLRLLVLCVFHHRRRGTDETPNSDAKSRVALTVIAGDEPIMAEPTAGSADKGSMMGKQAQRLPLGLIPKLSRNR